MNHPADQKLVIVKSRLTDIHQKHRKEQSFALKIKTLCQEQIDDYRVVSFADRAVFDDKCLNRRFIRAILGVFFATCKHQKQTELPRYPESSEELQNKTA